MLAVAHQVTEGGVEIGGRLKTEEHSWSIVLDDADRLVNGITDYYPFC